MALRLATIFDLPAINEIYNHYVVHSTATYQSVPSTLEERTAWFTSRGQAHPVYVLESDEKEILAWHSLSSFKPREAYARTVENSLYVHHKHLGKGLGRQLLEHQIQVAQALNHHTILAVICATQSPSIRLHESFGFTQSAHLKEVGHKFDRWLDVLILQKLL